MCDYVLIKLKDMDYYNDDFEYTFFIVKRDSDFEDKYIKLKELCGNYESFDEVDDFIYDNFEKLDFEERTIFV